MESFKWRASNESLPTKLNLFTRHILPKNICSLREEHTEDTIHCLWLCDRVKCIWLSDSIFGPPWSKIFRIFGDLVSAVLADASLATAALFAMVAWSIWIRRNKLREKQTVWGVGETVQRARELLQEFWDVKDCPTRSRVMRIRQ